MTVLLREAERELWFARRIASRLPVEAHLSKRGRLLLRWELWRLAEPISQLRNGRKRGAPRRPPRAPADIAPIRPIYEPVRGRRRLLLDSPRGFLAAAS